MGDPESLQKIRIDIERETSGMTGNTNEKLSNKWNRENLPPLNLDKTLPHVAALTLENKIR